MFCCNVFKFFFILYRLIFKIFRIELIFDIILFISFLILFWFWFMGECVFLKCLGFKVGWIWIFKFFKGFEIKFRVSRFNKFVNFLNFCFNNLFCVDKDFFKLFVWFFIWFFCFFIRLVSLLVFFINVFLVFLMEFLICFKRM